MIHYMFEPVLVWSALFCYGISTLLFIIDRKKKNPSLGLNYLFLVLGVLLLAAGLTIRWIMLEQGPFMTMYEVLLSNAFSVGLIYCFIFYYAVHSRPAAIIMLPFLLMLSVWAVSIPSEAVPLPETFDNYWLWFHVLSGKVFLGFIAIAASLSSILLFRSIKSTEYAADERVKIMQVDNLIWRLVAVAFVADTIMLVVGAVWAYDAWGRYWAWDPLETWALVTWLVLGLTMHARLTFNFPAWVGWVAIIVVLVLAFLTFFGVPFLSMAPHKGVF